MQDQYILEHIKFLINKELGDGDMCPKFHIIKRSENGDHLYIIPELSLDNSQLLSINNTIKKLIEIDRTFSTKIRLHDEQYKYRIIGMKKYYNPELAKKIEKENEELYNNDIYVLNTINDIINDIIGYKCYSSLCSDFLMAEDDLSGEHVYVRSFPMGKNSLYDNIVSKIDETKKVDKIFQDRFERITIIDNHYRGYTEARVYMSKKLKLDMESWAKETFDKLKGETTMTVKDKYVLDRFKELLIEHQEGFDRNSKFIKNTQGPLDDNIYIINLNVKKNSINPKLTDELDKLIKYESTVNERIVEYKLLPALGLSKMFMVLELYFNKNTDENDHEAVYTQKPIEDVANKVEKDIIAEINQLIKPTHDVTIEPFNKIINLIKDLLNKETPVQYAIDDDGNMIYRITFDPEKDSQLSNFIKRSFSGEHSNVEIFNEYLSSLGAEFELLSYCDQFRFSIGFMKVAMYIKVIKD